MKHTCEHCSTRYEIPDDKAAGRFLKVRCQRCKHTMHVMGLRTLDAVGEGGAVWWCGLQGQPRGPYRVDEVKTLVKLGDIHAMTRMWAAGMPGWERVCESPRLAWVYAEVVTRAQDELRFRFPDEALSRAALLTDGLGYFPDPTLRSGIILLDDDAQRSLQRLAARNARYRAQGTRAEPSLVAPALAAAAGLAAAASGVLWYVGATFL